MTLLDDTTSSWDIIFGESSTYGELNEAVLKVIAAITVAEAIRRAPGVVANAIIFSTGAAIGAAYATVYATEKLTTKRQAQELADWYADAVTDPYAWHVETDRVVQGAAHHLIQGVVEGLPGVPGEVWAVQKQTTNWLVEKFWKSEQAQSGWRRVGGWL